MGKAVFEQDLRLAIFDTLHRLFAVLEGLLEAKTLAVHAS